MTEVMGRHAQAAEEAIARETLALQAIDDGALKRLGLVMLPVFYRAAAKEMDRGVLLAEMIQATAACCHSMLGLVTASVDDYKRPQVLRTIRDTLFPDVEGEEENTDSGEQPGRVSLKEAYIVLAAALLFEVDEHGVTHIISADGNLDDDNIKFVKNEMKYDSGGGTENERKLIELLEGMELADRDNAWERMADFKT